MDLKHGPYLLKQHTIIFVPHARAKFRKWRFSSAQAGIAVGALVLLTLSGLVTSFLYFGNSFDRRELDEVRQENSDLKAVNARFETSIRDLEGQLADYQDRIHRLAIVAGLAELSPASEPGIGGLAPKGNKLDDELGSLHKQLEGLMSDMQVLEAGLDERHVKLSSMPTIAPVKGIYTSAFGYRSDPFTKKRAFHGGIDISAPKGRAVQAPGDAVVIRAGRDAGYGKVIYLSHGFGLVTRYGHLSKIEVDEGQKVRRGDTIGRVGNTGRSTGTHLHYEVRKDGRPVNPLGYVLDSIRQ